MKKALTVIMTALCMFMLATCAQAYEDDIVQRQYDASGARELEDALDGEAQEILSGFSALDGDGADSGLAKLWGAVTERFDGIFKSGIKNGCAILVCAVLCSVVTSAVPERYCAGCVTAAVLAVSAVSFYDVNSFMGLGVQTLDDLSVFSTALLPTLSAASAAAGAAVSSAAKYAASTLFLSVLMNLSQKLIVPLIYAYTAAGIADAAMGSGALKGAARLLKWAAGTIMKGVMIAFVTYLTLTGVISGATEAAQVKLVKTALSTLLPVVGGIISDASDTVMAGAEIVKSSVGLFGLIASAAVCLTPFLRMGVNYIVYKVCAALAGAAADSRLVGAIETVCTSLGMMLGLVGAEEIMLFLSVISFMRAVT